MASLVVQTSSMTLPPQLQRTMENGLLTKPRQDTYILGTVHIGSESAEEAALLIESVRPTSVVLEVPPSRIERIRRNNARRVDQVDEEASSLSKPKPNLFRVLPILAQRGWTSGGLGGLLFALIIVGGSMVKRSFSVNEETGTLPRRDEFAAAIEAADAVNARVIAADYEIDELIGAASAMSPQVWFSLWVGVLADQLGLRPADPIRRKKGESVVSWASRRRDIETARASRRHGEESCFEFAQILVNDRDARFANSCIDALASGEGATVCVVGLVHLDGVVERLEQ